jgi:transcriptional antiterminator RfaH
MEHLLTSPAYVSTLEPAWFCVRSKPKHEHIAAAHLRRFSEVEVFYPRLRVRKATRRGPVWTNESLFPNYLFARFVLNSLLEQVRFTSGVHQVVHFANHWPAISDTVIEELRQSFHGCELQVIHDEPQPGDTVQVVEGTFNGLSATVLRTLPARQRVQVLLDILGRSTKVELKLSSVVSEKETRVAFLPRLAAAG